MPVSCPSSPGAEKHTVAAPPGCRATPVGDTAPPASSAGYAYPPAPEWHLPPERRPPDRAWQRNTFESPTAPGTGPYRLAASQDEAGERSWHGGSCRLQRPSDVRR